jgi:hypothetical protein
MATITLNKTSASIKGKTRSELESRTMWENLIESQKALRTTLRRCGW